jgi:hypothetical protein
MTKTIKMKMENVGKYIQENKNDTFLKNGMIKKGAILCYRYNKDNEQLKIWIREEDYMPKRLISNKIVVSYL